MNAFIAADTNAQSMVIAIKLFTRNLNKNVKCTSFFAIHFFNYSKRLQTQTSGLKELSLCHKVKFSNHYIFAIYWCKPFMF